MGLEMCFFKNAGHIFYFFPHRNKWSQEVVSICEKSMSVNILDQRRCCLVCTPLLLITVSEWGGKYITLFSATMSFGTFRLRGCIWTVIYNRSQEIYSPRICLITFWMCLHSLPCSTCSKVFHCLHRCWRWKERKISVGLVNVCCLVTVSSSSFFCCEK